MPSKRKFYKTVIQVEILSEDPVYFAELIDVVYAIQDGDCSGDMQEIVNNKMVDGPTMAKLLLRQGSDPEFFRLTKEGEDCDDYVLEDEEGDEDGDEQATGSQDVGKAGGTEETGDGGKATPA